MLDSPAKTAAERPTAVTYEVSAIRYATLSSTKGELFHRYATYGEPDVEAEMAYYFWLLRGEDGPVLIDTGFAPGIGAARGRTCVVEPLAALAELGVEPAEVRTVILTHFHYDHIGNLAAFADAQWVVPRRELEFWTGELALRPQFAQHVERNEIETIERGVEEGRVRTSDGVEEILPGVTAITVGGHSPGQQLISVAGSGGQVLLTSDAVHFYEELERDRPFGVIADLGQMYSAYDRIRELGPETVVVPGHDPEVLGRFPAVDAGHGNVVRLDTG